MQTLNLTTGQLNCQFFPQHAVLLNPYRTLLLSDLHLGKANHFQKNGLAVPSGADEDTLQQLRVLIERANPSKVWVLGDLFHSIANNAVEHFKRFIEQFPEIEFGLITGNHDILASETYKELGLKLLGSSIQLDHILLTHEPVPDSTSFQIYGHIHPAVVLKGAARQRLVKACFWLSNNYLCLPAFGRFTGGAIVKPGKHDRIIVSTGKELLEVSRN